MLKNPPAFLVLSMLLCACAAPKIELRIEPGPAVADGSAWSAELHGKPLHVLVVPPSVDTSAQDGREEGGGRAPPAGPPAPPPPQATLIPPAPPHEAEEDRTGEAWAGPHRGRAHEGRYAADLALIERALMNRGFTVIAYEQAVRAGAGKAGDGVLTETEKALAGARAAGADIVLQVGDFSWSASSIVDRFFVLHENVMLRVEASEYADYPGAKYELASPHLRFVARVIDADNGHVLASIKSIGAADADLPYVYQAVLGPPDNGRMPALSEQPVTWANLDWAAAKRRTELRLVADMAAKLSEKMAPVPASKAAAAPTPAPAEQPGATESPDAEHPVPEATPLPPPKDKRHAPVNPGD
jgi:hypothetical protein